MSADKDLRQDPRQGLQQDQQLAEKETIGALLAICRHGPEKLAAEVPPELELPIARVAQTDSISLLLTLRRNRSLFSGYFR